MGAPWWRKGPLIDEDANTVAHVYWRNGALVDSKANSWVMNGTVPQVGAVGAVPPGAGQFSAANNYTLGSGNDVLDFAGDFTFVAVSRQVSLPAGSSPSFYNATPVAQGWIGLITNAGKGQLVAYNGAFPNALTTNSIGAGSVYVLCGGRASGTLYAKLNLGTTITAAGGTIVPGTTSVATIGYDTVDARAHTGYVYELYFTTTTPSDALFTAIASRVFSRIRLGS